jgi:magnesium chelatase family protein
MTIFGAVLEGIHAVQVQVSVTPGAFDIVGLSEPATRETRVRVRASLAAVGRIPKGVVRVSRVDGVPIGPGAALDLAVAVAASGLEVPTDVLFAGELTLGGEIRTVRGEVPIALLVRGLRIQAVIGSRSKLPVPADMLGTRLFATHLREVLDAIEVANLPPLGGVRADEWLLPLPTIDVLPLDERTPEWADVANIPAAAQVRDAVENGARVIVLMGPPGCGKTMVSRRIASLLPALTDEERLDGAMISSAAGLEARGCRPFRAPHHTASTAAIVGGGTPLRPGEITLAHNGVLLVDEAHETPRATIDALVSALKKGETNHTRLGSERTLRTTMPARPAVTVISIGFEEPREGHNPSIYHAKRAQDLAARFVSELGATVIRMPKIDARALAGAAS